MLALLARREHSRQELLRKLTQKGFAEADVVTVLDDFVRRDWQSDLRFAASFTRERAMRGYGPVRIRYELRERGVVEDIVEQVFAETECDWFLQAEHVRVKKFGDEKPADFDTMQKQKKFLQYRGFTNDQIHEVF